METLWYDGPSGGEWVPNPTAEQIVERMRRGLEYWGGFGPTGVLVWYEHPPQPSPTKVGLGPMTFRQQLILNRHHERGWYFEYSTYNITPRQWLVPFDPGADRDEYFPQWTTGERQMFLAGCFLPQAVAERIVSDFIASRAPSDAVQWAPFNDVVPRIDARDLKGKRAASKKPAVKPERAASIQEFLARRVMDAGDSTRFAEAICQCGCRVFGLEVDETVGEACWVCEECGAVYLLHAVATDEPYVGSPDYMPVDCQCTCGEAAFEIVVGVTLGQDETARTAYLGGKCLACGLGACYARWPRVDMPYPRFFANMKNRLR